MSMQDGFNLEKDFAALIEYYDKKWRDRPYTMHVGEGFLRRFNAVANGDEEELDHIRKEDRIAMATEQFKRKEMCVKLFGQSVYDVIEKVMGEFCLYGVRGDVRQWSFELLSAYKTVYENENDDYGISKSIVLWFRDGVFSVRETQEEGYSEDVIMKHDELTLVEVLVWADKINNYNTILSELKPNSPGTEQV